MIELKPCPFCNGEPSLNRDYTPNPRILTVGSINFYIICQECRVSTPESANEEEVIKLWNTRI